MTNLEWIAAGNTGCVFATLFARKPESVGWINITHNQFLNWRQSYSTSLVMSVEFPKDWTSKEVREWLMSLDYFYEEEIGEEYIGLRINMYNIYKTDNKVDTNNSESYPAWVQYFGPDSHVLTRRAPNPMIMWTRKLNPAGFVKQVGWNGILHLAHAYSSHIKEKVADVLWNRSFEQTKKILGHKPTIKEAAKVTWLKKDVV